MEAGGGAIGANEAAVSGRPAQPAAPTHPGLYSPSRSEGGRAGGDARWARAGRRGMGRDRTRGAGRSGVGGPKNRRWLGLMPQRKAAPRLITPRMVRPPRSLIRPDPLGPSASRRPRSYSRLETSPTGFIPPRLLPDAAWSSRLAPAGSVALRGMQYVVTAPFCRKSEKIRTESDKNPSSLLPRFRPCDLAE